MQELRYEQFVGTWELVSFNSRDEDSNEEQPVMGEESVGYIIYTADGYMAAQIGRNNRVAFTSDSPFLGTDQEYREAGSSYLAYCGKYAVGDSESSVIHSVKISFYPNWTGMEQWRNAHLEGDVLRLSTQPKENADGRRVSQHLLWRRVRPS